GWIFDRRQLRRLADLREPVDRRASAGDDADRQQCAGENEAVDPMGLEHEHYSAFRDTGALSMVATETTGAAVAAIPTVAVASETAGRGAGTATETWPRAMTTPDTVRFDCRFSTLTTSPSVPASSALPRMVR